MPLAAMTATSIVAATTMSGEMTNNNAYGSRQQHNPQRTKQRKATAQCCKILNFRFKFPL